MYRIDMPFRFAKQLSVVQEKDHEKIIRKIRSLEANPRPRDAKKLTLRSLGDFRIRVGDWRVIYVIDDKKRVVYLLAIDRRDKVYR